MSNQNLGAQAIDARTTNYCGICGTESAGVTAHAPARRAARSVMSQTDPSTQGSGAGTALAALVLLGGLGTIGFKVLNIAYHAYLV